MKGEDKKMSTMSGRGNHKRNRLFHGSSRNRPDGARTRIEEAFERQSAWDSLTPEKRLGELDRRLGKGIGAMSQRARLADLISGKTKEKSIQEQEVKQDKPLEVNSFSELQKQSSLLPEELEVLENAFPKKMRAKDRRKQEKN